MANIFVPELENMQPKEVVIGGRLHDINKLIPGIRHLSSADLLSYKHIPGLLDIFILIQSFTHTELPKLFFFGGRWGSSLAGN